MDLRYTYKKFKEFIANHFFSAFQGALAVVRRGFTQQLLNAVQPRVTADMNEFLMKEFTEEEVKNALIQWVISKLLDRMVCHRSSIRSCGM